MRLNKSILSLAAVLYATATMAQTGVASGSTYGHGQDSIRCRQNLSLFSSYAKAESYSEAIEPWTLVYNECPAASKNIYIYGVRIFKWRIDQEKDATKRQALVESLLKLYDDRAKYFGDDAKQGVDVIMANKITDYIQYYGDKVDYSLIYDWAKGAIEQTKDKTSGQLLNYFTYASQMKARSDEKLIEVYINDYLQISELLDRQIVEAEGNDKLKENLEINKSAIDQAFAASGLAGCDILQKVYTIEKVDAHKDDKGYLETTCNLFLGAGCDSPVYFQAARHLFAIEPSAKAAMGLAGKAVQDKKYGEAQEYLQKAIQYATNNSDKLKCYELMASIAMSQGNYATARSASQSALVLNPKSGRSLIILARMLGSSADNIFPDDRIKQRAVYYLVIDRLNAAVAADPSVSREANSLIAQYRQMLPSQADIFMHPELGQGKSFTVPGHGTTVIR